MGQASASSSSRPGHCYRAQRGRSISTTCRGFGIGGGSGRIRLQPGQSYRHGRTGKKRLYQDWTIPDGPEIRRSLRGAWVRLRHNSTPQERAEKRRRTRHLRQAPEGSTMFEHLFGRREDVEALHNHFKKRMDEKRARCVGLAASGSTSTATSCAPAPTPSSPGTSAPAVTSPDGSAAGDRPSAHSPAPRSQHLVAHRQASGGLHRAQEAATKAPSTAPAPSSAPQAGQVPSATAQVTFGWTFTPRSGPSPPSWGMRETHLNRGAAGAAGTESADSGTFAAGRSDRS